MARFCPITGKKPSTGNNVSHSHRKTRRRWNPNLINKTFIDPLTGQKVRLKISAKGLRCLMKNIKIS